MNTTCSKCGVNQKYYSKNNMNNLNCRYHEIIINGRCARCGSNPNSGHNCFHRWDTPYDRLVYNTVYCLRRLSCFKI